MRTQIECSVFNAASDFNSKNFQGEKDNKNHLSQQYRRVGDSLVSRSQLTTSWK